MDVPTHIRNHEAVVGFFGAWPSFLDTNVLRYEANADSISLTLLTWQITDQVDAKGYFVLNNHALASLRFNGIHDVQIDAFKSGNILFSLVIFTLMLLTSFGPVLISLTTLVLLASGLDTGLAWRLGCAITGIYCFTGSTNAMIDEVIVCRRP